MSQRSTDCFSQVDCQTYRWNRWCTVWVETRYSSRQSQREEGGRSRTAGSYLLHQLLLGHSYLYHFFLFCNGTDSLRREINNFRAFWQRKRMNLRWSWQCGRVCPFCIIDGIASQPYPLTAQTVVITPLAILIEECTQQTVGTVAIDENMREIQCDAVIPPRESQRRFISISLHQVAGHREPSMHIR